MNDPQSHLTSSAYGGENWSPRVHSHQEEIGSIWTQCGLNSEWAPMKSVLLHPPGPELTQIANPDQAQMLAIPNWERAKQQHNALSQAFREAEIEVHFVKPDKVPPPNLMFCADLFFMTTEGAILSRPASNVRAGEERWIARRLADLGIPILRTLRGKAIFEGADAAWIDPNTVLIGNGLRTNRQGIEQVSRVLEELGVECIPVDLPHGSMHLMGLLRFPDQDLAVAWPNRLPWAAVQALRNRGYRVIYLPDEIEANQGGALNFVTLRPGEILMAASNPTTQRFYEEHGITCHTVQVNELFMGELLV